MSPLSRRCTRGATRRNLGLVASLTVLGTAAVLIATAGGGVSTGGTVAAATPPPATCPPLPPGVPPPPTLCAQSSTSSVPPTSPAATQTTSNPTSQSTSPGQTGSASTQSVPAQSFSFTTGSDFSAPPPTLPQTPGAPPAPPELSVQTILLEPASAGEVPAGSAVSVHVTLEAKRGTDTYSVPHASASFRIASSSGHGAAVDPATAQSSDNGDLIVDVRTGDAAGVTVLEATSGTASKRLDIRTTASGSTSSSAAAPGAGAGSAGGGRSLLVPTLAAVAVAVITGLVVSTGRVPGLRKRSVWGRRSVP